MSFGVFNVGRGNLRWLVEHDIEVLKQADKVPRPRLRDIRKHLIVKFGAERTESAIKSRIKKLVKGEKGRKSFHEVLQELEGTGAVGRPVRTRVAKKKHSVRRPPRTGLGQSEDHDQALLEVTKPKPDATLSELKERLDARIGVMFRYVAGVHQRFPTLLRADASWLIKVQAAQQPQDVPQEDAEAEVESTADPWSFAKCKTLLQMRQWSRDWKWSQACDALRGHFPSVKSLFNESQARAMEDRLMQGHESIGQAIEALYNKTFHQCRKDPPWSRQELVLLIALWVSTPDPSPSEIGDCLAILIGTSRQSRVKRRTATAMEFQFHILDTQAGTQPMLSIFQYFRISSRELQIAYSRAGLTAPEFFVKICLQEPRDDPWSSLIRPDMRIWTREERLDLLHLYGQRPSLSHEDIAMYLSFIHPRIDQPTFTASSCKSMKRWLVDQRGKTIEKAIADLQRDDAPEPRPCQSTWTLPETLMVLDMYTREPKPSSAEICNALLTVRPRRRHESVVRRHVQYLTMRHRASPEALHARFSIMSRYRGFKPQIDSHLNEKRENGEDLAARPRYVIKESIVPEERLPTRPGKLFGSDFSDSEGTWDPLSDASDVDVIDKDGDLRLQQCNDRGLPDKEAFGSGADTIKSDPARKIGAGRAERSQVENDFSDAETFIEPLGAQLNSTSSMMSTSADSGNKENVSPGIHGDSIATVDTSPWNDEWEDDELRRWYHLEDDEDDPFYDADSEDEEEK